MEIFSVWCMLECVKGFEGFAHDMKIDLLINEKLALMMKD